MKQRRHCKRFFDHKYIIKLFLLKTASLHGAWAGGWAGACSRTAVDLSSLSLTGAMGCVGRRLFPYSSRFKLTEPHRRHAAHGQGGGPALGAMRRVGGGWAGAWSQTALDLRSLSLIAAMRPGGTRAEGVGGGERCEGCKDMHALYFKF